jgi:hypothetical protein
MVVSLSPPSATRLTDNPPLSSDNRLGPISIHGARQRAPFALPALTQIGRSDLRASAQICGQALGFIEISILRFKPNLFNHLQAKFPYLTENQRSEK